MPFKNDEDRKNYNREYQRERCRTTEKLPGICSHYPNCTKPSAEGKKQCQDHIDYLRAYKQQYRARPKPEGICNNSDCIRPARPGRKLCEQCSFQSCEKQKQPETRTKIAARRQVIQEEVLEHYGKVCVCCGETHIEFLTIDHIEGYSGVGPRHGSVLYRWLKTNNFPSGFRTLCMSCNFALGHVGYCSHGNLTCEKTLARANPGSNPYYYQVRDQVFQAYGGYLCRCCGDSAPERLSIDHVNNDGAAHRKEITGNAQNGTTLYYWLKRNGFPPGYQVLCMNCNFAKGHFGVCPHEAERAILPSCSPPAHGV